MKFITKEMLPLEEFALIQVKHICGMHQVGGRLTVLNKSLPKILSRDWLNPKLMPVVRSSRHSSEVNPGAWREHLEACCERVVEEFFKENRADKVYPVLMWRAALAFLEPIRLLKRNVQFIHLDVKRKKNGGELTVEAPMPIEERDKKALQQLGENDRILIADPMLATGSSAIFCIQMLKDLGVPERGISIASVAAAPEGICNVLVKYQRVKIYTETMHNFLDSNAYIRPGFGDAGDKYCFELKAEYFEAARKWGAFTDNQWEHLEKLLAG